MKDTRALILDARFNGGGDEDAARNVAGPKVVSSAEPFVLMMQFGAKATLIGEPTRGSSGRPVPHDLGNGVTVSLSSWEDQFPNGRKIAAFSPTS